MVFLTVQFLDKDVDVPVISTTRAYGGPDSVSRTMRLTCPFLCTTGAYGGPDSVSDKDADVPVVVHDRCPDPA